MEGGVASQSSKLEGDIDAAGEGDIEQEGEGLATVTQGSSAPHTHTHKREDSAAVSIQLFAMDEMYEMRSVDFLPAIFELFPVSHLARTHTHTYTPVIKCILVVIDYFAWMCCALFLSSICQTPGQRFCGVDSALLSARLPTAKSLHCKSCTLEHTHTMHACHATTDVWSLVCVPPMYSVRLPCPTTVCRKSCFYSTSVLC